MLAFIDLQGIVFNLRSGAFRSVSRVVCRWRGAAVGQGRLVEVRLRQETSRFLGPRVGRLFGSEKIVRIRTVLIRKLNIS